MKKNILSLTENTLGRDFAVGDIHGCFDLLEIGLKEINFNKNKDRLFSVGDLVNYGPMSHLCTEYLEQDWFFSIKGNHEDYFMQLYKNRELNIKKINRNPRRSAVWMFYQEKDVLDNIRTAFNKLSNVIEIKSAETLTGFVHANIPKDLSWGELKEKINNGDKETIEDITMEREKLKTNDKSEIKGISRIFLGHTFVKNGPKQLGNCFFIDTGAEFKHINPSNSTTSFLTIADIKATAKDICNPKKTSHPLVRIALAKPN